MLGAIIAPEFGMPPEEAKDFAKAIHDVNRHYNYRLLDQKTTDWINLIGVAGAIYMPRFMAIRERKKAEARPRPQPRPQAQNPVPGNPQAPAGRSEIDLSMTAREAGFVVPSEREMRAGEIPGVGKIEFPADHPLSPKGAP